MILDDFRLEGDVALVTGAGRGLGRALALGLAEAGADVALVGRNTEALEDAASAIRRLGRRALPIVADLSAPDGAAPLADRVADAFGGLDILVNNAGTTFRAPAVDFPDAEWERVMRVNLTAAFRLSRAAARHMKARGGGRIVNIASLVSHVGLSLIPPYVASKAALAALTRALAVEWAPDNIRVNAISPGYFRTDLTAGLEDHPDRGPKIRLRIPMKRWGEPDDLKGAVVFLASKASAYVTGIELFVDGGWMAC